MKNYEGIQFICSEEIDEYALVQYINNHSEANFCDCCGKNVPSISIDKLSEYIEECFQKEYGEPYELGAGYDKEEVDYENRFPLLTVFTTMEMLQDFLFETEYELLLLINEKISNSYWTDKDLYNPKFEDLFRFNWDKFANKVKHALRYTYFLFGQEEDEEYEYSIDVLTEIGEAIVDLKLIREFDKDTFKTYRARQHDLMDIVESAEKLGSPPVKLAKANRMSPAGISMFYSSYDSKTAILEVINSKKPKEMITFGKFVNLKNLNLIDFTMLGYFSIFENKKPGYRSKYGFINSFISELNKPIIRDDYVHVEYVPTQFVTEFFRYYFGSKHNIKVDGMIYHSSLNEKGKCVVLFVDSTLNTDDSILAPDKTLLLHKTSIIKEEVEYYIKKFKL